MRRQPFSLIEVILVIGLVALVAGLLGVRSYLAIQKQRFEGDVDELLAKLELVQELVLSCHADVRVTILEQEGLPMVLELEVKGDLAQGMRRLIQRDLLLHAIGSVSFDGERANPLVLVFGCERGVHLPAGNLHLRSKRGQREAFLYLPGYPAPIERVGEPRFSALSPPAFPEEVLDERHTAPQVS